MNILLYCVIFLCILVGCDTKDHTPLPGKREVFTTLEQGLEIDPFLKNKPIPVPVAVANPSWEQNGGNTEHAMPSLKLAKQVKLVWKKSIGQGTRDEQRLLANVVIANGLIFTMDATGVVSALKQDGGEEIWHYDTTPDDTQAEALGGGLCISGDRVYITTSFGEVVALQAKDGKFLWKKALLAPIRVAPTVDGQRIYIVTINNETHALDINKGDILWSHTGIAEPAALLGGASPAVSDDMVISVYSSGEVYAFDAKSGQILWSETLMSTIRSDTVSSLPHIRARPVIYKGKVYVVSHGGRMVSINLKTGDKEWQKDLAGIRTPAVCNDFIFVMTSQNDVLCLSKDNGNVKWFTSLPVLSDDEDKTPIFWAGPVLANETLVFTGSNGEIRFLSIQDGKLVHTLKIENNSMYLSPVIARETLYTLADDGQLYAWK